MFVTKRRCFDFATLFCQYQVCLKCRKLVYESFSVNENSSAMCDNERLHLFAKDEKRYPFLSIGSCSDKTEKGTLFLSISLSLKTIGKGVKFKKYKTFSVLIYSYINTSGNWKNEKLCGNTTPAGRSVFTQFRVFPIFTSNIY